jgi:hypothetical protein
VATPVGNLSGGNSLVAKEGQVAPASDRNGQMRYERARSEVVSGLKVQGNISVLTAEL